MALVATSARYATGEYGVAQYGVVNISRTVTGVATSCAIAPVQVGGLEIDITERVSASIASTANIATVKVNLKAEPASIITNAAIGTVTLKATSNIILEQADTVSTNATISEETEPQVTESVDISVSAVGNVGTVQVNLKEEIPTGVAANGAVGTISLKLTALAFPDGDAATDAAISDETEPKVQEDIDISLVAIAAFAGDQVHIKVKEIVLDPQNKLPADAAIGNVTTTAQVFNFEAVKEQYSHRRTVIISRAA